MSNGHNFYMDMGADTTVIEGFNNLAVARNGVANDVYIEVGGRGTEHFAAVDANKLRDAIDKAVGKREGDKLFSDQASIYQQVALHDAFDDYWGPTSTPSADDMLEKLDRLVAEKAVGEREEDQRISAWDTIVTHDFFRSCFDADGTLLDAMLWKLDRLSANDYAADSWYEVKNHDFFDDCYDMDSIARHKILGKLDNLVKAERTGAKGSDPKPYRPIDRDRLLRHIEDVEATLTRRNERHEEHQALIRDLGEANLALKELLVETQRPKTAREYLDLAWKNATVPEDDILPAGTPTITRFINGEEISFGANPDGYTADLQARGGHGIAYERRLLDPRVEPTADEKRRAEYEAQGLEGWEIELLMEASMS